MALDFANSIINRQGQNPFGQMGGGFGQAGVNPLGGAGAQGAFGGMMQAGFQQPRTIGDELFTGFQDLSQGMLPTNTPFDMFNEGADLFNSFKGGLMGFRKNTQQVKNELAKSLLLKAFGIG